MEVRGSGQRTEDREVGNPGAVVGVRESAKRRASESYFAKGYEGQVGEGEVKCEKGKVKRERDKR
jgi:hypothetical protein